MSCLDEIGSQVVHIQWNEPPRHSKAGSTPPEKRDEKIRKTLFFGGVGVAPQKRWATSAAISESSQEMCEHWAGISTKILGQLSSKAPKRFCC